MSRRFLAAALLAWLAPAAASEHPLAGTIWDAAGKPSSAPALKEALRHARFRLLGEVHDNDAQHAIQLELLTALGEKGLAPAVAFEQFDREYDGALRRRFAAAAEVAQAVQFSKRWNWDFYRPLVEAALKHGMPLRAANLSRADAARVARGAAPPAGNPPAPWTEEQERALRELIFEGHCRALPPHMTPGMAAAQRARDATMARALLDAPADGAVLIAGNGHVRRDLAVPLYLPAGSSLSVGLLEVEPGKVALADYDAKGVYDFVWFTARAAREDPCKAFAK